MNRIVIAAALLLLMASCREPVIRGKGPEKTEERTVNAYYDRIEIDAPVDANITIGSTSSLSLSGYENILAYIETKVEDSTLHITMKEGDYHFYNKKNLVANITLPVLTKIEVAGSGDAIIKGVVTGPSLKIGMSGSGDVIADNINVSDLVVDLSGSSDVNIKSGTTSKASYSIAGSGSIKAFGLQTTESAIEIAGSGDVAVTAASKLSIEIAGSGDVSYKGHPTIIQDVAGSGDIKDAN